MDGLSILLSLALWFIFPNQDAAMGQRLAIFVVSSPLTLRTAKSLQRTRRSVGAQRPLPHWKQRRGYDSSSLFFVSKPPLRMCRSRWGNGISIPASRSFCSVWPPTLFILSERFSAKGDDRRVG